DRDVVADDVVLADRRALTGLQPRADARARVDRGSSPDHRARPDDQRHLAVGLAARSETDDGVRSDHRPEPDLDVGRHDRGPVDVEADAGHALTRSRREMRVPSAFSDRFAPSSTRTTATPASPSLRGVVPSRMHSMKWRTSSWSASVTATCGLWM